MKWILHAVLKACQIPFSTPNPKAEKNMGLGPFPKVMQNSWKQIALSYVTQL